MEVGYHSEIAVKKTRLAPNKNEYKNFQIACS